MSAFMGWLCLFYLQGILGFLAGICATRWTGSRAMRKRDLLLALIWPVASVQGFIWMLRDKD